MLSELYGWLEAAICLYMTEFSPRIPDEGTVRTRVEVLRASSLLTALPARAAGAAVKWLARGWSEYVRVKWRFASHSQLELQRAISNLA